MSRPASRASGLALVAAALLLSACATPGGTVAPGASSSTPGSPASSATLGPTPTAAPTAPDASPTPASTQEPTESLPPFACSLPASVAATANRAQIHDIRVGTHDGYDRIVWEFESGIPAVTVERTQPPFIADPSGLSLSVHGSSFLKIVMQGGTIVTPDGTQSFTGAISLMPVYPTLVELKAGGDFEAVSTWYVGLGAEACVRVFTLSGPDRLVIDLQH
jgi:hypothetical protein